MPKSPSQPPRSAPIGLWLVLPVAAILYVLMLGNAAQQPSGGGESRIAAAYEALFITSGLWIVLALLLLVAGITGSMPRWTAVLAVVLVPTAAIACFTALDMGSRHMEWAIAIVAALPALVIFYALWARLPRLHAALRAEPISVAVWGAIFFLSAATFVLAA
jgi:hypothetical protein